MAAGTAGTILGAVAATGSGLTTPVTGPVGVGGAVALSAGAVASAGVAATALSNLTEGNGIVQANDIPKTPRGRGSVTPSNRDPKRTFTKKERGEMLDDQGGKCAQCDTPKTVDEVAGHHIKRHADGDETTKQNGASVCTGCHKKIHSKND